MLYHTFKFGQEWVFLGISLGLRPREIPRKTHSCPHLNVWYITFFCSAFKEELSIARDIAEFEKNKPVAKPISTLEGLNVSQSLVFSN